MAEINKALFYSANLRTIKSIFRSLALFLHTLALHMGHYTEKSREMELEFK